MIRYVVKDIFTTESLNRGLSLLSSESAESKQKGELVTGSVVPGEGSKAVNICLLHSEVKALKVLLLPVKVSAHRDDAVSLLEVPPQDDRRGGLVVLLRQIQDDFLVEETHPSARGASTNRGISHGQNLVLSQKPAELVLLAVGVELDLVDHRLDLAIRKQVPD